MAGSIGSVTVTGFGNGGLKYSVPWTSSAGGAVSGNGFAIQAGAFTSIAFTPNTAGTQPTDLYDVTLILSDGTVSTADLMSGSGADRSNATSSILTFDPPIYQDGTRTLDVVVANAGNAKTGTVVVFVQA